MAELLRDGDTLVLKLSALEKMEGVHGDIRIPVSSVQSIHVLDDVIHAVRGLKMPGSRMPGVFAMGTFVAREGKTFAIVHHQTKRGVEVILRNESFATLIVGAEDPEQLVASLALPEGH